jgi:hypothetical protein
MNPHNGHELHPQDEGQQLPADPTADQDELVLDMTDPDVSYLVAMTVVVFQELEKQSPETTEVPELQEQIHKIFELYEDADEEFVLEGDTIPVFVYMVYEIASLIDEGALQMEGTDEYMAAADDFLAQVEATFPDIMEDLLEEEDEDDDEAGAPA